MRSDTTLRRIMSCKQYHKKKTGKSTVGNNENEQREAIEAIIEYIDKYITPTL
jgi:oligoribonuclease (3'-5' exoribonuclease)